MVSGDRPAAVSRGSTSAGRDVEGVRPRVDVERAGRGRPGRPAPAAAGSGPGRRRAIVVKPAPPDGVHRLQHRHHRQVRDHDDERDPVAVAVGPAAAGRAAVPATRGSSSRPGRARSGRPVMTSASIWRSNSSSASVGQAATGSAVIGALSCGPRRSAPAGRATIGGPSGSPRPPARKPIQDRPLRAPRGRALPASSTAPQSSPRSTTDASARAVAGSSSTPAVGPVQVRGEAPGGGRQRGPEERVGGRVAGDQLGRVQVPALVEAALQRPAHQPGVQPPGGVHLLASGRPAARWSSRRRRARRCRRRPPASAAWRSRPPGGRRTGGRRRCRGRRCSRRCRSAGRSAGGPAACTMRARVAVPSGPSTACGVSICSSRSRATPCAASSASSTGRKARTCSTSVTFGSVTTARPGLRAERRRGRGRGTRTPRRRVGPSSDLARMPDRRRRGAGRDVGRHGRRGRARTSSSSASGPPR